jgi:hypothetical protein
VELVSLTVAKLAADRACLVANLTDYCPPGIRRKLGLSPFNASIRSGLSPLDLLLYVGGNKEIKLKFRDSALESNSRTKELLLFGAAIVGFNSYVYSAHVPDWLSEGISRLTNTWFVGFDWSFTVNVPLYEPSAQKLPV